jgi:hypothetical protein
MQNRQWLLVALWMVFVHEHCDSQSLASEKVIGQLEEVARFNGPMPTGVTVSNQGRIFVNFPKGGIRSSTR